MDEIAKNIGSYAPWVGFFGVFFVFLWRMQVLRLDVTKHHDEKLSGYADRIEKRLEHCEKEREELQSQVTILSVKVAELESKSNASE